MVSFIAMRSCSRPAALAPPLLPPGPPPSPDVAPGCGTTVGLATTRLYEGLSSIIMRANARALLARIGSEVPGDAADAQLRAHVALTT